MEQSDDRPSDEQRHLAASAVRPHVWASLAVNRTKTTCCLSLLPVLVCIIIIAATRQFRLNNPGQYDYYIRNDIRTRLDDARHDARDKYFFNTGKPLAPRSTYDDQYSLFILLRGYVDGKVPVINRTHDRAPNILTPESLTLLKKAEDIIIQSKNYSLFCLHDDSFVDCQGNIPHCALPSSLLNHPALYGVVRNGKICGRSNHSTPITQAQFDNFKRHLFTTPEGSKYSIYLRNGISQDDFTSWVVRSTIRIGVPFPSNPKTNIDITEDDYLTWINPLVEQMKASSTPTSDIHALSFKLRDSTFGGIALRDLSFAIVAVLLVFLAIWIHTSSSFLAGTAMLQIFLSFPLAYFFYRIVFRQFYFSSLQIMAIFLLLGIGADDVFIFTDAWKQAPVVLGQTDLLTRMSWTYRRAARAMTVTSITTAAAFLVTATSPIMPIGTLGVWASLLILIQFVLVITVYPCAVIIWERFWRKRLIVRFWRKSSEEEAQYELNLPFYQRFLPKKWRRSPDAPVSPTEYRPIERFFRGPWFRIIARARYFLIALSIILGGMSIWLGTRLEPPTEVEIFLPRDHPISLVADTLKRLIVRFWRKPREEEAEYELNLPFYQRFLPKKWRRSPDAPVSTTEYRLIERFFRGPWFGVIARLRYILIALGIVLAGVSIWLGTRLEPPTEVEDFLPPDHPINVAFDTLNEAFPASDADSQLVVRITWGIKDIDRTGTTKFDGSEGDVIMDDTFDFRTVAAQNQVLDSCEYFGKQKDLIFQGNTISPVICWIKDYKEWRKNELNEDDFETFANAEEQVKELIEFANTTGNEYILTDELVAFDKKQTRVVFTETRFVTSSPRSTPYKIMWPIYNEWIDLLDNFNADAPLEANKAIATGGFSWMWQITQSTLANSMFSGIGIMLAVAFVALAACTMNVVVAILAVLCIGGIVAMMLGIIWLVGWDLGISESVGVVISVGYSFDGVAHIATAYVDSKSETRRDRTRDALTDIGISILFGSLSTLLAGLMLYPAIITFFVKFAGLIVMTIVLSLIWSLVFFPALLATFGPTGKFGSFKPYVSRLAACFGWQKKASPAKAVEEEEAENEYQFDAEDTDLETSCNSGPAFRDFYDTTLKPQPR